MSIFKKKLSFFLWAVLLALSLAACGEAITDSMSSQTVSQFSQGGLPANSAANSAVANAEDPELSAGSSDGTESKTVKTQFTAQVGITTFLYEQPNVDTPLVPVESNQTLTVSPTDDPMWYATVLQDGTEGYLYGECLFRATGDGSVASVSLFASYAAGTFAALQEEFPEGKYWNHMDRDDVPYGAETPYSVTDIPCDNYENGEYYCNFYNGKTAELFPYDTLCQCLGFASFLSDQVFGYDAPLHVFYDTDLLRVGDHIRLDEWEHSLTVVALSDEGVTVGEVNANYSDCQISWSRVLSWYELEELEWDSEYISRYPMRPNGEGGFTQWDSSTGNGWDE